MYKTKRIKALTKTKDSHEIISVLWAWSSRQSLIDYDTELINDLYLANHPEPKLFHIFNPLIVFSLVVLILYQTQPKNKNTIKHRMCIFSPSCSNYAIGILRRYCFFVSFKKIRERLNRCSGQKNSINFE